MHCLVGFFSLFLWWSSLDILRYFSVSLLQPQYVSAYTLGIYFFRRFSILYDFSNFVHIFLYNLVNNQSYGQGAFYSIFFLSFSVISTYSKCDKCPFQWLKNNLWMLTGYALYFMHMSCFDNIIWFLVAHSRLGVILSQWNNIMLCL